jgi:hypothetical protein
MLFISYWELTEEASAKEVDNIAQRLTSAGLFPPDDVNVLRWDITPDGWGMTVWEGESATDIEKGIEVWRIAQDGFFKSFKTSPATEIPDAISLNRDLRNSLASDSRLPTATPDSRQTVSLTLERELVGS